MFLGTLRCVCLRIYAASPSKAGCLSSVVAEGNAVSLGELLPCTSAETCRDSEGVRNTNFHLFFCAKLHHSLLFSRQPGYSFHLCQLLNAFFCHYYDNCGYICSYGRSLLMLSIPSPLQIIQYSVTSLSIKCTFACLFSFNKTLWSRKHCQPRLHYFRIYSLNLVASVWLRGHLAFSALQHGAMGRFANSGFRHQTLNGKAEACSSFSLLQQGELAASADHSTAPHRHWKINPL